ncbi:hypothetical protein BD410DRAFT_780746 [Rickenella mellea]|uniref:Nephrocystin 3-like N-terminal domain-containing protein n=1 Tax=Rickenella mellea TaxID=50990 RepID=A0A4R5XI81_9AGAM|nr:hypothetical protein BD410DRAFT_780746 [Rickenella mellea]
MNTNEAPNPTRPNSFIEDGTYLIVNASPERRNHVILADNGSLAAGSKQQDGEPALNELWDLKMLTNGRFTIRSSECHEYASEPRNRGGAVVTQSRGNDWIITETRYKGQFVIGLVRTQLYWCLAGDDMGTAVTLRDNPAIRGCNWIFKKYDGALPDQNFPPTDPLLQHLHHMLTKLPDHRNVVDNQLRDLAVHEARYDYRPRSEGCLEGTRTEVIRKIMEWTEGGRSSTDDDSNSADDNSDSTGDNSDSTDDGSGRPICWLSGAAGAGKSAIAQEVATRLHDEKRLLASFFFRRGEGARSSSSRFIITLAFHISRSIPITEQLFQHVLHDNPTIANQPLHVQFEKLLVDVLCPKGIIDRSTPTHIPLRVIVIDALDECDDRPAIREFIRTLTAMIGNRQIPFLFFITSRVEEHIREEFEAIQSDMHHLSLDDFDARIDIHEFFRSRFENLRKTKGRIMARVPQPWPSTTDIDILVEKSSGLFIFASTLLGYVEAATMPHRELPKLLDAHVGIDPLYSQVLSSASHDDHFDRVLGTVILLRESLPLPQISHLLQLEYEEVLVELLQVQSVLKVPEDDEQPVQLMHASLRDFLITEERSKTFFINPPACHVGITVDCLRVIMDHQGDTFLNGKAEVYASLNWYQHFLETFMEENINTLLNSPYYKLVIDSLRKFQSRQILNPWANTLLLESQATVEDVISGLDQIIQRLAQTQNYPVELLQYTQDIQRCLNWVSAIMQMCN